MCLDAWLVWDPDLIIDTTFFRRRIQSLENAHQELRKVSGPECPLYDVYRAACVKEFELVLAQSGKLLRMCLRSYSVTNRQINQLRFKDVYRHAAHHDILSTAAVERWLRYRDNRNETAHEYGEGFAESTLELLPDFICDAKMLVEVIEQMNNKNA